jgi:hypothetical protein
MASSVAGLVASEEVTEDMERLRTVLDLIDGHFQASQARLQRNFAALGKIPVMVAAAHSPLSAYKKIIKHLHVLGVSTKIESARFADDSHSFDVLAEDVEKLSVVIGSRSDAILQGLASLNGAIEKALSGISAFRDVRQGGIWTMGDRLAAKLSALSEKRLSSAETARHLAARSEGVSGSISDVVSLLQVHDITRQQIEHVVETFDEIAGHAQNNGTGDDILIDILRDIGEVQIGQLAYARDEVVSAIRQVIEDLRRIADHVSAISRDAVMLVSAAGESGSSFLAELNESISDVMASFERDRLADRNLSEAMSSVTGTIGELSGFANDIEDIGWEIEIIALNARVKAAAAAGDGAALGVLAEAIKSLSDTARVQTLLIIDALKEIDDVAREFGAGDRGDGLTRNPEETTEDLEGVRDALGSSHESLLGLLSDLTQETRQLTGVIETIVDNITAHVRTDEVIGSVVNRMRKLTAESRTAAAGKEVNRSAGYLKDMASRYTMHQERHIHQSNIHSGAFPPVLEKDAVEMLGDNVELF